MPTSPYAYNLALAEQLRLNGMPEERVRDIVAEVADHVAATGQDPVEAFGQPLDYAAQWQPFSWTHWLRQLLLGGGAALALFSFVLAVVVGGSWTSRVSLPADMILRLNFLWVVIGLAPWTIRLWDSRSRARRLGERRAVDRLVWLVGPFVLGAVAWSLGVLMVQLVGEGTVLGPPRWVLLVVGLAIVPCVRAMGPEPGHRRYPTPPGTSPMTWRERIRQAFARG